MKQQDDLKRNIQDYQLFALWGKKNLWAKSGFFSAQMKSWNPLDSIHKQSFRLLSRLLKQKKNSTA